MRSSRRRRKKFERILPKPEVVITEDSMVQPAVSVENLEPSKARERPRYEATREDDQAFERLVSEVLDATGLEYEVRFEHLEYQRALIEVEERQAGALIGRRGASIDALELLLSRMASHAVGHNVPVQVDVNSYRARHEADLRELAVERAGEVLATGKDQHLEPMNPRDRRVVHLAIQEMKADVQTYTVGEGASKHIVIHRERDGVPDGHK